MIRVLSRVLPSVPFAAASAVPSAAPLRALALAAACLMAALPARATQDAWPALFDVARVASDDVLNVRSGPGARFDVVGAIPFDATRVEVIAPSDDHRWGLVNAGEGTGWVSLAFLDRLPGQFDGAVPPIARCFGTEPFWSLEVANGHWWLERPDAPTLTARQSFAVATLNDRRAHGFGAGGAGGGLHLLTLAGACGDGMSDRAYGLSAWLTVDPAGGEPGLLAGCCSLAD